MDWKFSVNSLLQAWDAFRTAVRGFLRRSKLPLLLLIYPIVAWLLLARSSVSDPTPYVARALVVTLIWAIVILIALSLGFCLVVSLWASQYRRRPAYLPLAFSRGLNATFALLALMLPAQAIVLALALYVADPEELWFWSLFVLGGSIAATVILLNSGLRERPGVYVTLRAKRVDLNCHRKLAEKLRELTDTLQVPLPPHILVGLQPEMLTIVGPTFCPEGELHGGVLCLSLPLASVLSVAEFSALAGEAFLFLHSCTMEGRSQFQATSEAARQVVTNLKMSMDEWRWFSRYFIHPFLIVLRLVAVAAIRFPLYLGKELVTFFVNQFWESRSHADAVQLVEAHQISSSNIGRIEVVSALIKEAALSLGARWKLWRDGQALHPLGEVAHLACDQCHDLVCDRSLAPAWQNPDSAWNYLQLRCNLSHLSLNWCLQMAKEVSPEPNAKSLFDNPAEIEAQLVDIVRSPFVIATQRAEGSTR